MKDLNKAQLRDLIKNVKKFREFPITVTKREVETKDRKYHFELVFCPQEKIKNDYILLNLKNEDKFTTESFNINDLNEMINRINEFLDYERKSIL